MTLHPMIHEAVTQSGIERDLLTDTEAAFQVRVLDQLVKAVETECDEVMLPEAVKERIMYAGIRAAIPTRAQVEVEVRKAEHAERIRVLMDAPAVTRLPEDLT